MHTDLRRFLGETDKCLVSSLIFLFFFCFVPCDRIVSRTNVLEIRWVPITGGNVSQSVAQLEQTEDAPTE